MKTPVLLAACCLHWFSAAGQAATPGNSARLLAPTRKAMMAQTLQQVIQEALKSFAWIVEKGRQDLDRVQLQYPELMEPEDHLSRWPRFGELGPVRPDLSYSFSGPMIREPRPRMDAMSLRLNGDFDLEDQRDERDRALWFFIEWAEPEPEDRPPSWGQERTIPLWEIKEQLERE